jgi:hypothetical protein
VTGQLLILAHATDPGASSVAARLAGRLGTGHVRVVRPEVLGLARWSHRVSARGRAVTRVTLPSSETLVSAELGAVFNRIQYLSVPRFRSASIKDRDYAAAELHAVVASWLAELGDRVVHDVRRHPWVIPALTRQQWVSAAAAQGLPVAPRTAGTAAGNEAEDQQPGAWAPAGGVLVAGGTAAGSRADEFGERCVAAAHAIGLPLLEFHFAVEHGATVLVQVDPLPRLVDPGAAEVVSELLLSLAAGAPA